MSALDVFADVGNGISPLRPDELRAPLQVNGERASSPDARPARSQHEQESGIVDLANQLDLPVRVVDAAHGMLVRHLSKAGQGKASVITAALRGTKFAELTAPGLVAQAQEEQSVGVAFLADPLVVLVVGAQGDRTIHWLLLPDGPSVTARADALRFLRAMAAGGDLVLQLDGNQAPPLDVVPANWDDEEEWRLFEDLATLEEWTGTSLPMPKRISAEQATTLAQTAGWIRSQQILASVGGELNFSASGTSPTDLPDEVRLHRQFNFEFQGMDLNLGEGVAKIQLSQVERLGEKGNEIEYRAQPTRPEVTFWLSPPQARRYPAIRTQGIRPALKKEATTLSSISIARSGEQRLKDLLAKFEPVSLGHTAGTSGLLSEIRGE